MVSGEMPVRESRGNLNSITEPDEPSTVRSNFPASEAGRVDLGRKPSRVDPLRAQRLDGAHPQRVLGEQMLASR